MAMTPPLTFRATGKPVSPAKYPQIRLNREPMRKGIEQSGIQKYGEFADLVKKQSQIDFRSLGKGAVKLSKSLGISVNITI